jgi:hypothetical protein
LPAARRLPERSLLCRLNERERGRLSYLAEVVLTEPEAAALPTGMPVEVRLPEARNGP